jgi:hypothetical protein
MKMQKVDREPSYILDYASDDSVSVESTRIEQPRRLRKPKRKDYELKINGLQ